MVKATDEVIFFSCDRKLKEDFVKEINKACYASLSEAFRGMMRIVAYGGTDKDLLNKIRKPKESGELNG
jgi:hypothetical protein